MVAAREKERPQCVVKAKQAGNKECFMLVPLLSYLLPFVLLTPSFWFIMKFCVHARAVLTFVQHAFLERSQCEYELFASPLNAQ
eukprot:2927834-Amphidinium_carterae.1